MAEAVVSRPATGARVVTAGDEVVLFGQPPEVLKGLMLTRTSPFTAVVLSDVRERDGKLTNNLEFPLYFFLFVTGAFFRGERLALVGDEISISHALRLLRLTLLGPTAAELDCWGTDEALKKEWLRVAEELALKNDEGEIVDIEGFFDIRPFTDGASTVGGLTIEHSGTDHYTVRGSDNTVTVDLNEDEVLDPAYPVQADYTPGGLVKMGLEVLGGASGFTPNEPCTGLALCFNGDYILIDSIPFLDEHLFARGISKNQISACFLTHLHDDHCTMFPLMLMPHVVEVITTREIYNMAMEKLACSLGWTNETVREFFKLVEVVPNETRNYYGLRIQPHLTVHSIPTIGASFSATHRGYERQICVVGDNHKMTAIRDMNESGIVRHSTRARLEALYTDRFSLLVADGGAGAIHGDPADALRSESDRVVYVHVEELSNEFDTTFSLASAGKRYTVIDGDQSLYTSQVNHYLNQWLGAPFPNRWMRSLLAEEEIRRYNTDDVILVQDAVTRGYVYLILTGYCEVMQHDGSGLTSLAKLQAGDVIGEMAIVTGTGLRNASVVARTPVTVCVFSEDTFAAFLDALGFDDALLERWRLRPILRSLPLFQDLTSTVLEKLASIGEYIQLSDGTRYTADPGGWYVLGEGDVQSSDSDTRHAPLREFGWMPLAGERPAALTARGPAVLVRFDRTRLEGLRRTVPQFNYFLRKFRDTHSERQTVWQLGTVNTR